MRKTWLLPVLTLAAGGVLLTSGCVSAATKAPAPATAPAPTTKAPAPVRAAATAGGTANIMIYGVNTDGAYWHAIVSGLIGDYGPAVSVHPDGQVDPSHSSEMELRLTDGSFRLNIAALTKKFVKATSHEPTYPKTCSDLISVTGSTSIVPGSGTRAYRGIRGSFPVTLTLNEVQPRPCQPSPGKWEQLITVAGSGTVSF